MAKVKLTPWGEFVARHTVLTPPSFWQNLRKEVRKLADQDADFDVLLDERIRGLQEFRERMYEFENEEG